ncbi:helix-turn-helix transcriptional regulator [Altererythrobacter sp. GH1-8]|uniref:helix-turn-helix transcriptional regulator n=1 Tax=Altererythrobacter sp. GH1-8 TaxID=3349333 RepID=UPI00374CF67E
MTRFLRLPAVLDRTGLTRATIYEMVDRGDFPRPAKIGARAIAWPEDEVQAWAEDRLAERAGA